MPTAAGFTRLYLVPFMGQQQIVDVPSDVLVLSGDEFVPPQTASTLTLTQASTEGSLIPFEPGAGTESIFVAARQEVRVCFREPSDIQEYPDAQVVEASDPSGGQCVCGITCNGPVLSYVKVYNVPSLI